MTEVETVVNTRPVEQDGACSTNDTNSEVVGITTKVNLTGVLVEGVARSSSAADQPIVIQLCSWCGTSRS